MLESRNVESYNISQQLASRNPTLLGLDAMGLASLLFPLFYKGDQYLVPQHLVIPPDQIKDIFAFKTATALVIVLDNAVPTMTITAAPEQTAPTR